MDSSFPKPQESPILLVDDEQAVLDSMKRILERLGYPVRAFSDPVVASEALDDGEAAHLVITDKEMPGMSGIELARRALEADPNTVVIVVTGQGDVESASEALRMGMVDYLLKPVDIPALEMAVHRALLHRAQGMYHRDLYGRLKNELVVKSAELDRQTARLGEVTVAGLSALVRLLEAKSHHFLGHSQAVSDVAVAIAEEMAVPPAEIEAVRIAGLLHDIGMMAVPDAIIEKGEVLTSSEMARVRTHPLVAEDVLRPFPNLGRAVDYVVCHHERLDGSGYPAGLTEKEIPLGAQVVAVADAYVALIESRPFRGAMTPEEALATLRRAEGRWFLGRVLDALEAARSRTMSHRA